MTKALVGYQHQKRQAPSNAAQRRKSAMHATEGKPVGAIGPSFTAQLIDLINSDDWRDVLTALTDAERVRAASEIGRKIKIEPKQTKLKELRDDMLRRLIKLGGQMSFGRGSEDRKWAPMKSVPRVRLHMNIPMSRAKQLRQ